MPGSHLVGEAIPKRDERRGGGWRPGEIPLGTCHGVDWRNRSSIVVPNVVDQTIVITIGEGFWSVKCSECEGQREHMQADKKLDWWEFQRRFFLG